MHASTSRDAGSAKLSGKRLNSSSLRKRTHGIHGANGHAHSHHHGSYHDRPLTRESAHEVVGQFSPISDSSREYEFERDETVATSVGEEEDDDDDKTPTGVEPRRTASATIRGLASEDVFNNSVGDQSRATRPSPGGYEPPSPLAPGTSKSWYEFDLAVVIALVSPIGNWLTGGDHVKKMFFGIIVVYYLHQIIEMPWDLYHKARPRRRGLPAGFSSESDRFKNLAQGELHRMENFFLFLAVVSPIIGAFLLRYATSEILGEDTVSWFSTGLFILSTGMRPWRHLVNRLGQRTSELQDFIHYPELFDIYKDDAQASLTQSLSDVDERLQKLERKMRKIKRELLSINDDILEYVDGSGKKHDKRYDKYEMRLKALESTIHDLQTRGLRSRRTTSSNSPHFFLQLKHSLEDAFNWALDTTSPTGGLSNGRKGKSVPLATIQEEEDATPVVVEPQPPVSRRSSPRSTFFRLFRSLVFLPVQLIEIISAKLFRVAYRMAVASY